MTVNAIYHNVFANEGFEEAAKALFRLVKTAEEKDPGGPRHLFLDIEGHKNKTLTITNPG